MLHEYLHPASKAHHRTKFCQQIHQRRTTSAFTSAILGRLNTLRPDLASLARRIPGFEINWHQSQYWNSRGARCHAGHSNSYTRYGSTSRAAPEHASTRDHNNNHELHQNLQALVINDVPVPRSSREWSLILFAGPTQREGEPRKQHLLNRPLHLQKHFVHLAPRRPPHQ